MRINVVIHHREAIPETSAKTGIPLEELTRRFDEAEQQNQVCGFNIEMTDEEYRQAEGP